MVGVVKRCLRKTVGFANLNYLELETILIKIEGVANDRPLLKVGVKERRHASYYIVYKQAVGILE